jgi:hypothetical protein
MRTMLSMFSGLLLLSAATAWALPALPDVPIADEAIAAKGKKKGGEEPATPPPPPPDRDGDGQPDADDKCPDEPEDKDGFEDGDGCLDGDNDGDGIVDAEDRCPGEAENKDGWDDADGCPEKAPAIAPMTIDAELLDGTKVKGKLVRIVAIDEDNGNAVSEESATIDLADETAGDEFQVAWADVTRLEWEKVTFMDVLDCYSKGAEDLGDAMTWECTVKHPTRTTLKKTDRKTPLRIVDRKMRRFEFKVDEITCEGPSCATVQANRGFSTYLFKIVASTKSEEESEALGGLQKQLREMQLLQLKKATLTPAT